MEEIVRGRELYFIAINTYYKCWRPLCPLFGRCWIGYIGPNISMFGVYNTATSTLSFQPVQAQSSSLEAKKENVVTNQTDQGLG